MREEIKQKMLEGKATESEIYNIERTLTSEQYFRYTKEVENQKKNIVVGILLALFLGS